MSYSPEPLWSVSERASRFFSDQPALIESPLLTSPPKQDTLLTTIARNLGIDLTALLLRGIAETRANPRWEDIPLPQGRTLRSCQHAYEEMRSVVAHATTPAQHPMYQQQFYPMPPVSSTVPRKRSYDQEGAAPGRRHLQPAPPRSTESPIPPVTNGESFIISRQPQADRGSEPPPKKRGRPSREAVEQREKEYAAKGMEYIPPPKRRPKKPDALAGSPLPRIAVPDTSAEAAPIIETPLRQTFDAKDESSSGKRKRKKREENLETERSPITVNTASEATTGPGAITAQSPSDRLLARGIERGAAFGSDLDLGQKEQRKEGAATTPGS